MTTESKTNAKIDLTLGLYREDETPWYNEFTSQPGVQILEWRGLEWKLLPGVPKKRVTLLEVLRAVYASTHQQEPQEDKDKKNRLLRQLNQSARKKKQLVLTPLDASFTLEQASKTVETVAYGQLKDAIDGLPLLGIEDEEGGGTEEVHHEDNQDDAAARSGGAGEQSDT